MIKRALKDNGFFEWFDVSTSQPKGFAEFRGEAGVWFDAIKMLRQWANEHT